MTVTKKKKVRNYRGSKTHGGGAMKKRRGAGSRGGRGRAGSGKRSDSQKPSYWKDWEMGKHGFTSHSRNVVVATNVSDLHREIARLVEQGKATQKGSAFTIDLSDIGVDKLLGSGKITSAVHVTVKSASARAIEKVEAAGGSVSVSEEALED